MLKLYSIKDTKGGFYPPEASDNDALAVRTIRGVVNSGKGLLAQYPEDFELWYVGEFDNQTGIIAPGEMRCIVRLNALLDHVQDA